MRDICFRGFHECDGPETVVVDGEVKRGRWVVGSHVPGPVCPFIVGKIVESTEEYVIQEWWWPVLPATVGQFSGLHDRNGREIFEGDRVRWLSWDGRYREAAVVYDPEWNRLCVRLNGAESLGVNRHLSKDVEVLGTVFDKEATT